MPASITKPTIDRVQARVRPLVAAASLVRDSTNPQTCVIDVQRRHWAREPDGSLEIETSSGPSLASIHVPLRSSHVKHELNATQIAILRWIAEGNLGADATNGQRLTARALSTRRLVKVKGRGPRWHAELTDPGHHYLTHDGYPPGHFGPNRSRLRRPRRPRTHLRLVAVERPKRPSRRKSSST